MGRILQIIGWIWVAFGFFGPTVNLPGIPWFPGFILVFISRILRANARRREPDLHHADAETPTPNVARRPDPPKPQERPSQTPKPPPQPVVVEPSRGEIEARLFESMNEMSDGADPAEVDELLEQINQMDRPKSSAEMIAEARERWNKRP